MATETLSATPAVELKAKIATDTAAYTAVNIAKQILGVIRGLIVARTLGPSSFGIWNGLSIFMQYSAYSNMGLFVGMTREYGYFVGRKELGRARGVRDAAFTFGTTSAVLVSLALLAAAFALRDAYPPVVVVGIGVMAMAMVFDRVYNYHIAMFRVEKRIVTLSLAVLLLALVYAVGSILLVSQYGLYALFAAFLSGYVAACAYLLWQTRETFRVRFDFSEFKRLLPIGLPLDIGDVASTSLNTMGGIVILLFLSTTEMGYYGIGNTFISVVMQVPSSLAWVINPHLLERYGETGDVRDLWNYAVTPTMLLAYLLPILIAEAVIILPLLVRFLLPAYAPGVPAITILFFGNFFYAMLNPTGNFLIALNRQVATTLVRVISSMLGVGFLYGFLSMGLRLEGVALGTSSAFFVLGTSMVFMMLRYYYRSSLELGRFLIGLYAPYFYAVAVFVALQTAFPTRESEALITLTQAVAVKVVVMLVAYVPVLVYADHKANVLDIGRQIVRRAVAFASK
ncbi:MAG: oligosaccharide flippase family protein [Chloroflexi bacterium]|nr:oligosaccharide flippase family protein [Chloroflexota bacterium]